MQPADWVNYTTAVIQEGRRYGKRVYVFLWPEYADVALKGSAAFLPPDYWTQQLNTARLYADGIVIWGGYDFGRRAYRKWDDKAPWWGATQNFMTNLNACK